MQPTLPQKKCLSSSNFLRPTVLLHCGTKLYMDLALARVLPGRTWINSQPYFENMNLFQCDWYIRGQFDHDMNFTFAYMWFYPWETLGEHKKLLPAELSCTEYRKHISNICLPATSAHHACYKPHHPQPVLCSFWFWMTCPPLHNNPQAATLLRPTFTIKLQDFFKVKHHTYCITDVFLIFNMCKTVRPIFMFWNFKKRVTDGRFWVLCCVPNPLFLISPVVFTEQFCIVQSFVGTRHIIEQLLEN